MWCQRWQGTGGKNCNLSGLGDQEIEVREIVTAEESKGIMKGKSQKNKKESQIRTTQYLWIVPWTTHVQSRLKGIHSFKEKYLDNTENDTRKQSF